jgi:hypothetical protein
MLQGFCKRRTTVRRHGFLLELDGEIILSGEPVLSNMGPAHAALSGGVQLLPHGRVYCDIAGLSRKTSRDSRGMLEISRAIIGAARRVARVNLRKRK